jgi:hypothetical protein
MDQHLGVDEAAVEHSLHRDRLAFGHFIAVVATRSKIDEGAAAIVLQDELVAKDLGHSAFYGDRTVRLHPADRTRRQEHDGLRLAAIGGTLRHGSAGKGSGQHRAGHAHEQPRTPRAKTAGRRERRADGAKKGIFCHLRLL